jgi:signal transduction histidine kinase
VDQVLQQVRGMSLDLRPSMLDDLGLVAALRWYVGRDARGVGLRVLLEVPDEERRYDPAVETACFRVAQEALTNILRHAGAKEAIITLDDSEGALRLCVRDDGAGFDVAEARQRAHGGGSFGLLGMQERVSLLGGHLEFNSKPGQGTELRARFPLAPPEAGSPETKP